MTEQTQNKNDQNNSAVSAEEIAPIIIEEKKSESSYSKIKKYQKPKTVSASKSDKSINKNHGFSSSKLGLAVLLCVIFLIVGILWITGVFRPKSNPERLLQAILKTSELSKMDLYHEVHSDSISIVDDFNPFLSSYKDFLNNSGFKLHSKLDAKNSKSELDLRLNIKGIESIDINVLQQKQEQIIAIPKLLSQPLYLSKDGILSLSEETSFASADALEAALETLSIESIEKAKKYFKPALNPLKLSSFKKLNEKKYLQRILEYYDKHMVVEKGSSRKLDVNGEEYEIKGDIYLVTENLGDFAEFYNQLLLDLVRDENFKPFVEEYLERIISVAEKNKDLVLYNGIALASGKDSLKLAWDEEVKGDLVFWKEFILDKIDKLQEEMQKPHYSDLSGKWINALKESDANIENVFVVDGFVKYTNTAVKMNPQLTGDVSQLKEVNPKNLMQFHISSALLSHGETVQFTPFQKEKSLDYSNANQDEIRKFFLELESNVLKLVDSIKK